MNPNNNQGDISEIMLDDSNYKGDQKSQINNSTLHTAVNSGGKTSIMKSLQKHRSSMSNNRNNA